VAEPAQSAAPPGGSPARRLASRLADWLLPAENPAGAIYGLIVIGALLAAESGRHESYLDTLLSAAIAATLYWVAHSYAEALGTRLRERRRLTPGMLVSALGHDAALIRGAAIPLLALAIAALGGASQATAVTIAVWSAIVCVGAFELLAGVRSGATRGELALETAIGVAMGLAILALKVVLH
jgi:hypothetical protein